LLNSTHAQELKIVSKEYAAEIKFNVKDTAMWPNTLQFIETLIAKQYY